MSTRPRVAVSLGDPCGVGPEVTVRALADPALRERMVPVVFGDARVWRRAVELTGVDPGLPLQDDPAEPGEGVLVPVTALADADVPFGGLTAASGDAQRVFLESATDALVSGLADALCTAPITKAAIAQGGFDFPGHTEFLAHRLGGPVAMMLAGPTLRVSLVTIHEPLSRVPSLITEARVCEIVRLTESALREWFGVPVPRIGVCGLNPHAGEEGRFGREEIEVIGPAIRRLQSEGLAVTGPFAADGLITQAARGSHDAVVAMYHDQGLAAIKALHFDEAVNVTLGLPRPRTSPDHGSALDIAGRGLARPDAMKAALRMAADLARRVGLRRDGGR